MGSRRRAREAALKRGEAVAKPVPAPASPPAPHAPSHDLGGEPESGRRGPIRAFVIGVLLLQIAGPLSYYLGDDPYDERFSWRMFSEVRVRSCEVTVSETVGGATRPVELRTAIHGAWIETLRRNRRAAIRALLRRRCDDDRTTAVHLENRCTSPGGRRLAPAEWSIECASGDITEPEVLE